MAHHQAAYRRHPCRRRLCRRRPCRRHLCRRRPCRRHLCRRRPESIQSSMDWTPIAIHSVRSHWWNS